MNEEMIGNFIENMATDAMKDNFLALNNKEKHKEFCDLLDKNRKLQNNWNELKKKLERRINSYEERKKLGEGYELTEVMEISLACDKRFLKEMQELEQDKDE